jgi:thymidylate kinase
MMRSMEAAFVIQPWIATRTITDYCRLCYQARDGTSFLECKRAQLGGYNSLLAGLTMQIDPQFGDTLKLLEDAKETCLSTIHPNENCHEKMQNTLQRTHQLYDKMLDEYKNRYATIAAKPSSRPPM